MNSVLTAIRRLVEDGDGQDLIEYGLLAALIAVVVATGVTSVGQTVNTVYWQAIANAI